MVFPQPPGKNKAPGPEDTSMAEIRRSLNFSQMVHKLDIFTDPKKEPHFQVVKLSTLWTIWEKFRLLRISAMGLFSGPGALFLPGGWGHTISIARLQGHWRGF
jgi:hypothetical protein